jgi:hypothetical protein
MFCFVCSRIFPPESRASLRPKCSYCGAETPVEGTSSPSRRSRLAPSPTPAAPAVVLVRAVDPHSQLLIDPVDGELAAALGGGVLRGATILVSGPQGAGKSTIAAEFIDGLRRRRGGLSWWLDRDQMSDALVAALFKRTGGDLTALRIVGPRPRNDPDYKPISWRDAIDIVPESASGFVVDSLQRWADSSLIEQDRIMEHLLDDPTDRVAVVISRTNSRGDPTGHASARYDADADLIVTHKSIVVVKSRWTPGCPLTVPRAPREPVN